MFDLFGLFDLLEIYCLIIRFMKILIIGGGPVGLFLAIKLIEHFSKNVEIKLYEKRKQYTRQQIILFQPYLLQKIMPSKLLDMFSKQVCHTSRPSYDNYGFCFEKSLSEGQNLVTIPLNNLENILNKYLNSVKKNCESLQIINKNFDTQGNKELQWADIVISAEGRKSYIRDKIMKTEMINHPGFSSYGVALTFQDKSNPQHFIKFNEHIGNAIRRIELKEPSIEQHRKRFFRSIDKWTYLGLQIDSDEFEDIDTKIGNSDKIDIRFDKLPNNLKTTIKEYLDFHGSNPVNLDKTDVYVFKIKLSHAEIYARLIDEKPYFVIGDAAIASHFFTAFGINSGFAEVQNFIDIINNYKGNANGLTGAIDNYNYIMNQYREENIAGGIDATLPFRQVNEICRTLTNENMLEMAKQEGFHIKKFEKLSKKEMCNMLAKHLIEKYKHVALLPLQ